MIRHDSRRGASNLGVPLMLLSFALMGGLLYWLAITAEPTEVVIVEEEPEDVFLGTVLDAAVLETPAITGYEGLEVRVADVPYAQAVGSAQFFVSLPQGSPFLVRMSDQMIADSVAQPSGIVTITGMLYPMSDSVKAVWSESGSVTAADQPLVDFAAHYIEATEITTGAPDAGADSMGESDSGSGGA